MDSMVWVEVPIEEWNKNNSYGLIESIYPIIGIGDNSNTDIIIIDSYLDLTFYKPTDILIRKPLSEVIKDKMPTEEEMETDFCYLVTDGNDDRVLTHDDIINENTDEYSWFMQGQQQLRDKLLNNG